MKLSGWTGTATRARRWSSVLVTAQIVLTLILLAEAVAMMRVVIGLRQADAILDTSGVLTMRLTLPSKDYPQPADRVDFYRRLDERLKGLPGISSVTLASALPMSPVSERRLSIPSQPPVQDTNMPTVASLSIGPGYFETLRLPLVLGRGLTSTDGRAGYESVIVNQRFADTYFPYSNPIGQRIELSESRRSAGSASMTIVGVSQTIRQTWNLRPGPVVYLPYAMDANPSISVIVRSSLTPGTVTTSIRQTLASLDPDLPLFDVLTMDQVVQQQLWFNHLFGGLFAVFACMALVLSTVGLYGVTAHVVSQRTREIGVRMALGAEASQVRGLVLRRALRQLGIGLVIGLAGAVAVGKLVGGVMAREYTNDPAMLAGISVLLVLVSLASSFFPARRATRLNPVNALRYE